MSNEPRRMGTLWSIDAVTPLPAVQTLIEARFSRAAQADTVELAKAMGQEAQAIEPADSTTVKEIQQRFTAGRRCYLAWVGQRVAAYGWVSFDEETVGELGLRLRLLPGEAYIWDCATLPIFRQKRLFRALLEFMVTELRVDGMRRIWIGADPDNLASRHAIDAAGFQRVADLLVPPGAAAREGWLVDYPGVPPDLLAKADRLLLGDVHTPRVG